MRARRVWQEHKYVSECEVEMGVFLNILIILAIVLVSLFVLTFIVYFFNLDMKLMAAVQPLLLKLYDKKKRERKL